MELEMKSEADIRLRNLLVPDDHIKDMAQALALTNGMGTRDQALDTER